MSPATWFRLVGLSGLLIVFGCAVPVRTETPKGKRYALLVGVKAYKHGNLPDLAHTENDVEELAKVLNSKTAPFDEVILLTSTRGEKDDSFRPTAANIRAQLKRLLKKVDKHDLIIVGLAGHGLQLTITDPKNDKRTKDESFFCPADARPTRSLKLKELQETMIPLGELFGDLEDSGAGVKLLLVDACRNDPKLGRSVDTDNLPRPSKGTAALFSCKSGERAFETKELGSGHGVFFYHVIEALKGKARNLRGEVTWTRMSEYVIDKVTDVVPVLIGGGARQTPHEIKNLEGKSPVLLVADKPVIEKEVVGLIRAYTGHTGWVQRFVLTPDGKKIVSSGDYLRVWDVESGKELRKFHADAWSWGMSVSHDSKRVLAGVSDHSVRLFDIETGEERQQFVGHTGYVWVAVLSRDGKQAITGAMDKTIHVWNAETGKLVRSFEDVTDYPRCACLSPDGKQIAIGHYAGPDYVKSEAAVRIWDIATGKLVRSSEAAHTGAITSIVWSPDGKRLATSSFDKTVRLWDVTTLKEVKTLTVSDQGCDGVAFLRDGRRLVATGWATDLSIRVWDIAKGKELVRYDGHTGCVINVAVTIDGKRFVSSSTDGTLRLWSLPR